MRVILLGAGASKAYSESPTGVRMPIAKDFFDTFDKLDIAENPWVLQDGVLDYIMREYKKDPYMYLRSGIDIEDFHSDIEEKLRADIEENLENNSRKLANFKSFNQLIYIFSSVINEIQNGPVSKPHSSLARKIGPEDVIITFNWDTLMDRALKQETNWCTDDGYGFKAHKIYRNEWIVPTQVINSDYPKIIKLHGSTNWITSHQIFRGDQVLFTHVSSPESVFVYESTLSPYSCHAGRYMEGYTDFSYGYYPVNLEDQGLAAREGYVIMKARANYPWMPKGKSDNKGIVSIPLIIPPVKDKKYDSYGDLFNLLWDEALDSLSKADEIIIIGYSFPRTDHRSHTLFKNAFLKRNSMPKIKILDPHPEKVAEIFKIDYGIVDDKLFVYKDFFSEEFDLDSLFLK